MPLSLQPVLRFLEQKSCSAGSAEVVRVDARVVSATNAHLLSLVARKFREDLYYRLAVFPSISTLRDRIEDIITGTHFLENLPRLACAQVSLPP